MTAPKDQLQERKAQLTPAQLLVAERWESERSKRDALLNEACTALDQGDQSRWKELTLQACETDPDFCEHGRSTVTSCMACEEIERILWPEHFDEALEP